MCKIPQLKQHAPATPTGEAYTMHSVDDRFP